MSTWLALDVAKGNLRHYISGYKHSNFSSHFLAAFQKGSTQNTMQGVCLPLCQPTEQASKIVAFKCLLLVLHGRPLGAPAASPGGRKVVY
jgi:hypothetical protein